MWYGEKQYYGGADMRKGVRLMGLRRCNCDIGQVSSLFWALVGHERSGLDNLKSLGWGKPEVEVGSVLCREGTGLHRFWERGWRAAEEGEKDNMFWGGEPCCRRWRRRGCTDGTPLRRPRRPCNLKGDAGSVSGTAGCAREPSPLCLPSSLAR